MDYITFRRPAFWVFNKVGFALIKTHGIYPYTPDMEADFIESYKVCQSYTQTSIDRMYALYQAVNHVTKNKVAGDFVECGVWRGGSSMLAAMEFAKLNDLRRLYLYDTYEGMAKPTKEDVTFAMKSATSMWTKTWNYASLAEVQANMLKTGYPEDKIEYIKGKVEKTIPKVLPEKISILRLDTDLYSSTLHELKHLFPRLVKNGVVIIDDYGYWLGAKQAVDKYFKQHKIKIFLMRVDHSCRIGIKQ